MSASCKLNAKQKRQAFRVEVRPKEGSFGDMPFECLGEQAVALGAVRKQ